MERRSYALFTGLFVLSLGLIGAAFTWWLSRSDIEYQPYAISAPYNVAGLSPYSTVLLRGVAVGKVTSIGFDTENTDNIRIGIEIDSRVQLTTRTFATLRNQGVTGLSQVMLDNAPGPSDILRTSKAKPASIPMRQGVLDKILGDAQQLMDNASTVVRNLAVLTRAQNAAAVSNILNNVDILSAEMITLQNEVSGLPTQMKASLGEARTFMANLNRLNGTIRALMRDAGASMDKTNTLIEEIDATSLPHLYETLSDISLAARDIRRLAQALNQDPQSLIFGADDVLPGPGEPGYQRRGER